MRILSRHFRYARDVVAHYKMKIQTTILTLLLISFCSCDIQTEDNNDKKNVNNSSIQKSGLNKSDKTDRNKMIKIVADEILNKFQKEQVSKYEFDNDGNFYIELFSDTVSDKSDETYKEYYRINKDDIITGRLNADDKIDFAIKSIWSPESGNIFGIEWHIYVSENNKYKRVKNDFGGGKFSDLETVTEISEMKLTTEFQDFNEETSWLKDSVEFREYQLIDNKLNRLE